MMHLLCFQGYTALHLASIHGHQRLVHALIHLYSESIQLIRRPRGATLSQGFEPGTGLFPWQSCGGS